MAQGMDFGYQRDPDDPDKVTPYALNQLHRYVEDHDLNYNVYYKNEGYPGLYWKFIGLVVYLYGKINPDFYTKFQTRVTNASSKDILFPSRVTHGDHSKFTVYRTLRHELVHIRDAKRFPVWFQFSYTFLFFPLGLAYMRADWEFRAYAQTLIVTYNQYGVIDEELIQYIAAHFHGNLYFWMWPFKKTMLRKIRALVKAIEEGTVYGYYPSIHIWDF